MSYKDGADALVDTQSQMTLQDAGHNQRHNDLNNVVRAIADALEGVEQDLEEVETSQGPNVGLTIVELEGGGWSGDAPPGRENGENPILFVPWDSDNPTDPSSDADGIDTPSNIRDWDLLGPVTVGSL